MIKKFENFEEHYEENEFGDIENFLILLSDTLGVLDNLTSIFETDYRRFDPEYDDPDDFENIDEELYTKQLKKVKDFIEKEIENYKGN